MEEYFKINHDDRSQIVLSTQYFYVRIPYIRNQVQDSANDPGSQCGVSAKPKWVRSEVKIRRRINIAPLKRTSAVRY